MSMYALRLHNNFVHLTIESGSYLLDPQVQNSSFLNKLTKRYFILNFNIISDSSWQDLSIEPIEVGQLYR